MVQNTKISGIILIAIGYAPLPYAIRVHDTRPQYLIFYPIEFRSLPSEDWVIVGYL